VKNGVTIPSVKFTGKRVSACFVTYLEFLLNGKQETDMSQELGSERCGHEGG
jgi:hypothetical protein